MKTKLLLCFLLVLLLSCGEKKETDYTEIKIDLKQGSVKLSDIFKSLKVIPLETTEASLVEPETKLLFTEDHIFIPSNNSIRIFDIQGNFVRNFNRKDNGNEEYLGISDFLVDETKQIIEIFSGRQKKIFQYDYNGTYQGELSLDFLGLKVIRDKENLFIYAGNEKNDENTHKFKAINDNRQTSFYEIDDKRANYLHIINLLNFYKGKDEILFFEAFNDTIYTLQYGSAKPKYAISYNGRNIPASFYENEKFSNVFEFFQKFNKYNYVNSTYNVFETAEKLFFQCYQSGKKYLVIYDKVRNQSFSYDTIIDDMFSSGIELPFQEAEFIFFASSDSVSFMIYPNWILDNDVKSNKQNINLENIKEDDNPLLFIGKL